MTSEVTRAQAFVDDVITQNSVRAVALSRSKRDSPFLLPRRLNAIYED
jgi:hypothetical protein